MFKRSVTLEDDEVEAHLQEYFQTLLRFCGSWLHWTSAQALSEDLNYIAAAREGYYEMLEEIFGKPEETSLSVTRDATGQPIVFTPQVFDAQFDVDDPRPFEIRRKH